jgi:hypothetical protein
MNCATMDKMETFTNFAGVMLGCTVVIGMLVGSGFNVAMFKALVFVALLNYGP